MYIGDNELFPTNHTDKVFVDSINGRAKVYTIQEYDQLEFIETSSFFTRADYDPLKKKLSPDYKNWDRYCEC